MNAFFIKVAIAWCFFIARERCLEQRLWSRTESGTIDEEVEQGLIVMMIA